MSIFIDSKYTNWYFSIINKAKNRQLEGYGENHHIIPKSCGGIDQENIIRLTAKEHFVCHHLLTKMMTNSIHKQKMCHAFWRMLNGKHKQFVTAKAYDQYRKICLFGKNNPFYGKKHTKITKKKQGISNIGNNYRSKQLIIDNIKYISITEAAEKLKLGRSVIKRIAGIPRMRKNKNGRIYIMKHH